MRCRYRWRTNAADAVVTRSALIYVADKARAAAEFYRVLRPGGRVSVFEPISSRYQSFADVDLSDLEPARSQVLERWVTTGAAGAAMTGFDERDLTGVLRRRRVRVRRTDTRGLASQGTGRSTGRRGFAHHEAEPEHGELRGDGPSTCSATPPTITSTRWPLLSRHAHPPRCRPTRSYGLGVHGGSHRTADRRGLLESQPETQPLALASPPDSRRSMTRSIRSPHAPPNAPPQTEGNRGQPGQSPETRRPGIAPAR